MKKIAIILSCLFLLLVGCSNNKEVHIYAQDEQEKSNLQETLEDVKDLFAGNVLLVEDELLVAIQINPWVGFKEQKIEKKLQQKLENQYPNLNVLVSTDYKLFWESNQLMEDENNQNLAEEVKKLKDLAKEET